MSSPEKLAELERRWRESKSPADEAAWLRERVKAGDLTEERLELAASCGHQGAERACGIVNASAAPRLEDMTRTLLRLPEAPVAAVGGRFVALGLQALGDAAPDALRRAVTAIEDYERCPCEGHRSALFLLTTQLGRLAATGLSGRGAAAGQAYTIKAAYHVCQAIQKAAKQQHEPALAQLHQGLEEARRTGVPEPDLALAVQSGIVAWALRGEEKKNGE